MQYIAHWISGIRSAFKNKRSTGEAFRLLFCFLKIELKFLCIKIFRVKFSSETLLGYRVAFPNYLAFRHLFSEIFLLEQYAVGVVQKPFIIDCGSNIGMSILYFKRKYPDATVIAFEPDKSTFDYLKGNIDRNNIKGVELHQAALYNKNGEITFLSARQEDWCAVLEMSVFASSLGDRELKETTVPCVKLSDFITRDVDMLKVDVQGAETIVVNELADSGKLQKVDQIIMEYHYDDVNNPLGTLLGTLQENQFGLSLHAFHQDRMPPFYQYRDRPYCFGLYAYRKRTSQ